ncbi:MAG: hypothetical protein KUL77_01965 [Thermomonas sp.]|uniref:T6SS immunity protein Tli4 family protein n=1 Tax=Thermomonas sp. TaxID=1971895 RepID=UPI001EB4ABD7|nr:T6SS immunity protein Tli4 family protein [Thermomonas sp.]MBV2208312.1 hypothetical protein [Thermomonas sp.]
MTDTLNPGSVCVGRLVVDLPIGAKSTVNATFNYMEVQPPKPAASFNAIKQVLEDKTKILAGTKTERNEMGDRLARRAGFDPDKIFGTTQLVGSQIDGSVEQAIIGYLVKPNLPKTIAELHKFAGGYEYVFRSDGGGADTYPATRTRMWNAALNFQPVNPGELPVTPGFCVDGGMFSDPGSAPLREGFTLVASFKNHPDANFVIDSSAIDSIDTNEPSLKHRVDSELGILRANVEGRVSVLIRGEREAAGQKGYQIGLSVPNDSIEGTTAYKFFWAADGVPNDASHPFMEVSLTIQPDEDKPASFENAKQAQAFWDELLQRIKIRPGAVGGSPTR